MEAEKVREVADCKVERAQRRFVNLAKQDVGRARKKSLARAGRQFSQPQTSPFLGPLYKSVPSGDKEGAGLNSKILHTSYMEGPLSSLSWHRPSMPLMRILLMDH